MLRSSNSRMQRRNRKGQALAEYAVLLGGILLVTIVAVAVLGHKINDMTALTAVILPGAHADDNAPIISGKIVETTQNADGNIALDVDTIVTNSNSERLGNQLGVFGTTGVSQLVIEAVDDD